jgi:hypothetical protein
MSLHNISYDDGRVSYPPHREHAPETALAGYLDDARRILAGAIPMVDPDQIDPVVTDDFDHLRWFPLPGDIAVG